MAYPIFFLPIGDIMTTARVEKNSIKILKKTLFPAGLRYSISAEGIAACIDKERKLIIYGQLLADGSFAFYKIVDYPEMIFPKSLLVIKQHIILGGENNFSSGGNICPTELVATYNILSGQFTALEMPYKHADKCVDDLILNGETVIAVDNIVYPKYILDYDVKDLYSPQLIKSYDLPNNGTYESIIKGHLAGQYIALLSSTYGRGGGGRYINIFNVGNYEQYIRLVQWFDREKKKVSYQWKDILVVDSFVCISADKDGIGFFKIHDLQNVNVNHNDRSNEVRYINQDNKQVLKIIAVPDQSHLYIVIAFSEGQYYYKLISKTDLLNLYDQKDYKENYKEHNNYDNDFYSLNDISRDYFDAMTDGQLGNYDDFKGNFDDIDDWAGR